MISRRPRRNLVSAGFLSPVQSGVCLSKKTSKLGRVRCIPYHANANGELHGKVLLNKCTRFAGLANALRNLDGYLQVNAWQKDRELVSTLSSKYCRAASRRLFQRHCETSESAVPCLMPYLSEASKGINVADERETGCPKRRVSLRGLRCDSLEP